MPLSPHTTPHTAASGAHRFDGKLNGAQKRRRTQLMLPKGESACFPRREPRSGGRGAQCAAVGARGQPRALGGWSSALRVPLVGYVYRAHGEPSRGGSPGRPLFAGSIQEVSRQLCAGLCSCGHQALTEPSQTPKPNRRRPLSEPRVLSVSPFPFDDACLVHGAEPQHSKPSRELGILKGSFLALP